MTRHALVLLSLSLTSLGLLVETSARAADVLPNTELNAEARKQYKLGTDALAAQRYVEAALHFETATSKNPHAVSWYMAAEAWERGSRLERAADALAQALDVPGLSPELGDKIRARLKTLESSIGTVVVGGAASYRASLDGGTAVAPPARLHGLPGTHVITIIPPDHAPYRRELMLSAGVARPVNLGEGEEEEVKPPPAPEAPEIKIVEKVVVREVPRPAEPRKYIGFGALGLGAASLAGAVILGVSALDARDAYRVSRTQSAFDHVRLVQSWANVALLSGAVLVAGGVVLVVWPNPEEKGKPARRREAPHAPPQAQRGLSLDVALTGASLRGTF